MFKILRISLLCIFAVYLNAQNNSFCNELKSIERLVKASHYQPKTVNDSLSKHVFFLFLNAIDENKRFFTEADYEGFKVDRYQIDDYLKDKDCQFISKYSDTLKERIDSSKIILSELRDADLDYSGTDSLYYDDKRNHSFFKNDEAVKNYWNKKIRFAILKKIVETDSSLSYLKSNFKTLEADLKPKIIDNEICLLTEFEQSQGTLENLVTSSFLDAFLKYQDPNSAFFSSSDKAMFEHSVSNSEFSFGISTAKESNGDIVISHIAPGSAAFKNGGFEVNDVILSLTNTKETLETYCVSNETISNFLNNEATKRLTFKIKKKNGHIESLNLKKSKIDIETNSITGYILEGDTNVGYVNIPSFYTDTESYNGLGVANDVAKQIYKLQRENIEALILDLRFNGGGSMKEAADLSGMFIDRGPLAITKARHEENYTIRDPNRGTIFTKPIVVLVNQFSASASEFFAGALQDYNSAIIVGSPTHGKASSQIILPIENSENGNFVKLTVGQFFRVTGNSHQKTGVIPDVLLPNMYEGLETEEKYSPFALENSNVEVTLKHRPKLKKNIQKLKEKNKARIDSSTVFNGIKAFNKRFINDFVKKEGHYPLNLEYIFKDRKEYNEIWDAYSDLLNNNNTVFQVANLPSTQDIIDYNEDDKVANAELREELAKDPYIQEAYHIIQNLKKL